MKGLSKHDEIEFKTESKAKGFFEAMRSLKSKCSRITYGINGKIVYRY